MLELPNKAFIRPSTIAAYFDVHLQTVYKWIYSGRLPASMIARSKCKATIRAKREDVLALEESFYEQGEYNRKPKYK